jgi:hypothetical protein
MRRVPLVLGATAVALLLAGCSSNPLKRSRPDEFAVARQQPLIVPPDFALAPPKAGEPATATADSRAQAMQALFGGPAPRAPVETQMLKDAGADRADPGARSVVGDPNTPVVDKGTTTQTIINAPATTTGQEATVTTPQ